MLVDFESLCLRASVLEATLMGGAGCGMHGALHSQK